MSSDSDIAVTFNALREEGKAKRAKNREWSAEFLTQKGISHYSNNGGVHLIVEHGGETVDFWPGTGKFIFRGNRQSGRGVKNLVRLLERAAAKAGT